MLDEAPTHHGLAARSARRDQAGAAHNACRADHLHPGASLGTAQGYWAVVTSVIVMQASVGGSLKAGLDRMLGTVAGAIWGVSVTLAIPHHDTLTLGLTLAVALTPLALVAALKPNYRVAPVTAIIVLLSTTGVQLGPVRYAIDRVLEIGLGCLVGFAVSLLVLPARAHGLLAEAAEEVILALRDLLELLLQETTRSPDGTALAATHLRLSQALSRVEGLFDEVKRERANRLTDTPDAEPFARNLRRLRHDLTAIGRTVTEPLPQPAPVSGGSDGRSEARNLGLSGGFRCFHPRASGAA